MRVALVAPAASDAAEAAGEVGPVHGVVVSVKGAGGFVRCCDRDARVYFSMADVDPASIPSRLPRPAAAAGERQQAGGSVGGANGDAGREDAQGHGGRDEVRRRATLPSGHRLAGGFLWTGSSLGFGGGGGWGGGGGGVEGPAFALLAGHRALNGPHRRACRAPVRRVAGAPHGACRPARDHAQPRRAPRRKESVCGRGGGARRVGGLGWEGKGAQVVGGEPQD